MRAVTSRGESEKKGPKDEIQSSFVSFISESPIPV